MCCTVQLLKSISDIIAFTGLLLLKSVAYHRSVNVILPRDCFNCKLIEKAKIVFPLGFYGPVV